MLTPENLCMTIDHIQSVSQQYLAGDPAPFQACWSQADDVTLCGGWGGRKSDLAWSAEPHQWDIPGS